MRLFIVAAAAALASTGCGSKDDPASNMATTIGAGDNMTTAAAEFPDACTFLSRAELESMVGWELREGKPEEVPGGSSCTFKTQLGKDVTRTFPNPALPRSIGMTSVTISTSPADPEAVAEIRRLDPGAFEDVPGLGDDAYYLGPDLLHVRVGQKAFSVRINSSARSEGDVAKVRAAILALARTGVERL